MDIDLIRQNYRLGEYKHNIKYGNKVASNYVFDENLTIKQNREMIEEHNAKVESQRKEAYTKQAALDRKLTHDVCCYITENYDISHDIAVKIQQFCYTEKHHDMYSYFEYITTIADFVDSIINPD